MESHLQPLYIFSARYQLPFASDASAREEPVDRINGNGAPECYSAVAPCSCVRLLTQEVEAIIRRLRRFFSYLSVKRNAKTPATVAPENTTQGDRHAASSSLRTPFGLQVKIESVRSNGSLGIVSIRAADSGHSNRLSQQKENKQNAGRNRYRLLPSLETSYLWHDTQSPTCTAEIEAEIEEDTIFQRYPALAPFYRPWRQSYEKALTQQEIHPGAYAHVFPDLEERVAWEVAGYMIACWLVLQGDVECVQYHFGEVEMTQNITKGNIDTSVVWFLEYQLGILEGRG